MYDIKYAESVVRDLAGLRAFDRKRILDQIDEQLLYEPTQRTRNRKIIPGLQPPWEHEEPIWELRIRDHRVFYDVDEVALRVMIRAIRHKPSHKTMEEIL